MTTLSVNINKVALLRNSRGRDFPNVRDFAASCLNAGAKGITLHPRQDQRHARYSDVSELQTLCDERGVELNVEGYPSDEFLAAVVSAKPAQCTLVPDAPGQLTSDQGWKMRENSELIRVAATKLRSHGIRVSLFVDYDDPEIAEAKILGADRVELYTEPYASAYNSAQRLSVLNGFRAAAKRALQSGLGINAGHDLSLENLSDFLSIPNILEVSIGHALVVECIDLGLPTVIGRYLEIIEGAETHRHVAVH